MIKPIETDKYGNPVTGAVVRAVNALIEEHNLLVKLLFVSPKQFSGNDEQISIANTLVNQQTDPNTGGPVAGTLK